MEKFRNKRSTVIRTGRSSDSEPALPGGNKQVQRQRKLPNLSSDSSSCGGGAADEDSFSSELGWKSSKQLFGTPMKNLLAEEMSKETESKRRAPSVIARLMGLDGLPLQQSAHKLQKGSSEFHLQRTAQVEKSRSGRLSRRNSNDQQEFKDVFEVSEISKVQSSRYSSQGSADLKNADAEISFIEQKFMDVKRLATDRDLQTSKEFDDALEVLDSNTELLLKYFQRPDSLFKKHLDDLQAAPLQSHCGLIEAVKSSDIENHEHGDFSWKPDRDTTRLSYHKSHLKHDDGYPHHFERRHSVRNSPKASKLNEPDVAPTRIVVLKPNPGTVQNATKFPDVRNRDIKFHQKKNLPDTVWLSRQNSMESREIAKEITRQMKNNLNNGSVIFSSSRFRGYAGDDSSCSFSGNESAEEPDVTAVTLGDSFHMKNHIRSSSHSSESSVSREAKKRLSERWKMTHKSQQVQAISSRGSTLAEMLAIPDKEIKAANFDSFCGGEGFHDKFASNGAPAGWVEPLGISSRDGWKDGCIGSLSRSKSLPASSAAFGIPRTIMCHEALRDERFMMPKEAVKRDRKKVTKGFNERLGVNPRSSRSSRKKSWSSHGTNMESEEFSPGINSIENKVTTYFKEVDTPKQEVMVSESLAETLRDTSEITEDVIDAVHENVALSSVPPDEVLPESSCVLIKSNTAAVDKDNSVQQELSIGSSHESSISFQPPLPGLESSCPKDADQPSPVSVLEPSFTDDLSSCSECFESLSADLQGLRMQLQLLKLESEDYVEGPMLISSDEDGGEVSIGISEANELCKTEDSWEASYILDVLFESGIDGAHPDAFLGLWHSPECPVNPSVFDELEKRYSDRTTCPRSERRLLFDRINTGLVKICQQSLNAQPWVLPATTNIGSKLIKNGLRDGLCALLGRQGKGKDDTLGKVLVRESQWMDVRDDIDVIGREVERLLLDDLVAEMAGTDILYPSSVGSCV